MRRRANITELTSRTSFIETLKKKLGDNYEIIQELKIPTTKE